MAGKKKKRSALPSVEEVLEGRGRVDAHQLAALISAVNPTGRQLGGARERERYAQKARLQSELLRRFWELVRVEESEPGIVAITLAETGQQAAHCPLEALDDDVRSRVRRALDVHGVHDPRQPAVARTRAAPSPRQGLDALLAEGRDARERWELERALACFEAARAAAPENARAARALLELLVDSYGQDARALAEAEGMPRAVQRDPGVRAILALAAARQGERDRAVELLHRLEGARAADAWAMVAQLARQADDEAQVRAAIEGLERTAPGHAALVSLREHLEKNRERAREREEEALLEEERSGRFADEELARRARDLAHRHGASAVAAQLLARMEAREREARRRALLSAADAHAARGEDDAAIAAWREAIALGAEVIGERLREAEERASARRAREEGERIARAFERDAEAAIVGWLEAEEAARDAVRLDDAASELVLVAEILAEQGRGRAKAVARAAIAFCEASAAVEAEEPARAARLLDEHASMLEALAEVEVLRARIATQQTARSRGRRERALDGVEEALASGALDEARRLLTRARTAQDPRVVARRDALAARVRSAERRRAFGASIAALEAAGDWLGALARCEAERTRIGAVDEAAGEEPALDRSAARGDAGRPGADEDEGPALGRPAARGHARGAGEDGEGALVRSARDEEGAAHRREVARHHARAVEEVRAAYRFEVLVPEADARWEMPLVRRFFRLRFGVQAMVDPDTLLGAFGAAGWVVLRWLDVHTNRVTRMVRFRDPDAEEQDAPAAVAPAEGHIFVVTERGRVYTLSADGSQLHATASIDAPLGTWYEPLIVIPESRWAWHLRRHSMFVQSIDLRSGAAGRTVADTGAVQMVWTPEGPQVLRASEACHEVVELHDPRGGGLGQRVTLPGTLDRAVWSECEGGLVGLCGEREDDARELVRFDIRAGTWASLQTLPCDGQVLEFELTESAVFLGRIDEGGARFEAFERGSREPRWSIAAREVTVLRGPVREGPLALVELARGARVVRLSLDAPPPAFDEDGLDVEGPDDEPLRHPMALTARAREHFEREGEWARGVDGAEAIGLVKVQWEFFERDPDIAAANVAVLREAGHVREPGELLAEALAHSPEAVVLASWRVQQAMDEESWEDVRALLAQYERSIRASGERELARHLDYARSLLRYRDGDLEGACAAWAELEAGGDAIAEATARWRAALMRAHEPLGEPPERRALVLALIRRADRLVAEGRAWEAFDALDCQLVWRLNELQSLVRLAMLGPTLETDDRGERVRVIEVVAECVRRAASDSFNPPSVIAVPGAHLIDERVAEIVETARGWLTEVR